MTNHIGIKSDFILFWHAAPMLDITTSPDNRYTSLTIKTFKMKTKIVTLAFAVMCLFVITPAFNNVQAQSTQRTNVGQLVSGLINVNVGAVAVNVGDITLEDLVDVGDILSNNRDIDILTNILNNSPILSNNSEILTNLLRDADILNNTQVVVGVLSGQLVILDTVLR
jgi:hypothetical protein